MPGPGEWVHEKAVSVLGLLNRGHCDLKATNGLVVALHRGGLPMNRRPTAVYRRNSNRMT